MKLKRFLYKNLKKLILIVILVNYIYKIILNLFVGILSYNFKGVN